MVKGAIRVNLCKVTVESKNAFVDVGKGNLWQSRDGKLWKQSIQTEKTAPINIIHSQATHVLRCLRAPFPPISGSRALPEYWSLGTLDVACQTVLGITEKCILICIHFWSVYREHD
jgi:hypothetical protein